MVVALHPKPTPRRVPAPNTKVTMPALAGLTPREARARLREQSLKATVEEVTTGAKEAETVLGQSPTAGAQLRRGVPRHVRSVRRPTKRLAIRTEVLRVIADDARLIP